MEPKTLSRQEIRATVVSALLATKPDQQAAALVDDETAIGGAGLGISSLNMLQALVRIEDSLGIVFDDRTVADAALSSVGSVVDLVEHMLAEQRR
ncbi:MULTISPECIES: phosphopantetheine-binding protein [unclassified Nocardia]|uniref:phosphopantetheine-binding protein n=1 Tax=unclassified Nocardia TaxID=2637762 RepID=UPI001CE49825|nr:MULTISPECIES: phosphopantetheine-binding protein [unclassified Nocardia]